ILTEVFLFDGRADPSLIEDDHRAAGFLDVLGRRDGGKVETTGREVVTRVAEHAEERVVGLGDRAVERPARHSDDVRVDETLELLSTRAFYLRFAPEVRSVKSKREYERDQEGGDCICAEVP